MKQQKHRSVLKMLVSISFLSVRKQLLCWIQAQENDMAFIVLALTELLICSMQTIQNTKHAIVLVKPKGDPKNTINTMSTTQSMAWNKSKQILLT